MRLHRTAPVVVALAVLVVAAACAGSASAATSKPLSQERNLDTRLRVDVTFAPGQPVPTISRIAAWVPKGVRAAGSKLPSCNPALLETRGPTACPPKSKVGSGTGLGYVFQQNEPLTITMFNGPGGALLTYVRGYSPVSIGAVVQAVLTKPSGGKYGFGQELDFPFPDGLLYPVPGAVASLLHLDARLDGKAGWLRSRTCPPHGWSLASQLTNTTGGTLKVAADLRCV